MTRPLPNEHGVFSTRAKLSLADMALALRDEQIEARVVHYKGELETSPELDAITASVVSDFQALRGAAQSSQTPTSVDRSELEIELIAGLRELLSRLFRADRLSVAMARRMGEISKRFARHFFESELHGRARHGGTISRKMRFAEQALFHALSLAEPRVLEELAALEYENGDVLSEAKGELQALILELRNSFLSRTTPELNELITIFNDVLARFFTEELAPNVGDLAWEVVREARLAEGASRSGFMLPSSLFARFRHAFEKHFLQRLVSFAEDAWARRLKKAERATRHETLVFVSDPRIFSDVCELTCESVYDFLSTEGFLEIPIGPGECQQQTLTETKG